MDVIHRDIGQFVKYQVHTSRILFLDRQFQHVIAPIWVLILEQDQIYQVWRCLFIVVDK